MRLCGTRADRPRRSIIIHTIFFFLAARAAFFSQDDVVSQRPQRDSPSLIPTAVCRCRCLSLPLTPCPYQPFSWFWKYDDAQILPVHNLRSIRRWNYPRRFLPIGDKTPAYPATYHTTLPPCTPWDRCKLRRLRLQLANRNCTPTIPQSLCFSTVHFGFNVFQV